MQLSDLTPRRSTSPAGGRTPLAPRVLVTGVSVAGPALAWGLHRAGFDVTLLERSASPREAGQNIDVRGLGREVLRRMSVEDQVLAELTGEEGTRYVDDAGRAYATFPRQEGVDGPTAEVEVLRGTLARILLEQVPDAVPVRYGDFVTAVTQDANGVDVQLAGGSCERYDLLLVAEGRTSRTRRLLFADETEYRDRGVTITYGTIDRTPEDDGWWHWYTGTRGRVASIRPDNAGTTRASMSFESEPMGFEQLDVHAQLDVLRARFAGAGWQVDRVLDGFARRPEEFYAQRMEQVVVSRWSKGRVALVGDSAWGSGPTGMGTTLSLVGAHVMAGQLARTVRTGSDDPAPAFERYEQVLRRYADSAQGLPPGGARILHPSTRAGVSALRTLHRAAASPPAQRLSAKLLLTSARHEPRLPRYPHLQDDAPAAAA